MPGLPLLLDTNVILNALTGRVPLELKTLLANLAQSFVSVPVAELSWTRLDPAHQNTTQVVGLIDQVLRQIDGTKVLTPSAGRWETAGERAGLAVRAIGGEIRTFKQPAERYEILHDALTALIVSEASVCVVTQDRDFDLFAQLDSNLNVLLWLTVPANRGNSAVGVAFNAVPRLGQIYSPVAAACQVILSNLDRYLRFT